MGKHAKLLPTFPGSSIPSLCYVLYVTRAGEQPGSEAVIGSAAQTLNYNFSTGSLRSDLTANNLALTTVFSTDQLSSASAQIQARLTADCIEELLYTSPGSP